MAVQLPPYIPAPPPAWCLRFVGLPYERGARGPDLWDCWGLLMLVLADQFGLQVPAYEGIVWKDGNRDSRKDTAGVIERESLLLWQPVEPGSERGGDAIVLRMFGNPLHIGVIASPGWMLHASEGADSALERYDGLMWRNRVEGFWRRNGARHGD